jgi:hypothetical protein
VVLKHQILLTPGLFDAQVDDRVPEVCPGVVSGLTAGERGGALLDEDAYPWNLVDDAAS